MTCPPTAIRKLNAPPGELARFLEEIAQGMETLYGPAAAEDYRNRGLERWALAWSHPHVAAFGAYVGDELAALLTGTLRSTVAQVHLIHVLKSFATSGVEQALVHDAVAALRLAHVDHFLIEAVPFCNLPRLSSVETLGFKHVARQIMMADAAALGPDDAAVRGIQALDTSNLEGAARCLCSAYAGHPGRMLHYEVNRVEEARAFLWRAMNGYFGRFAPGFALQCRDEKGVTGMIVAVEAMPGVGFILQVAVHQSRHGQGLGTGLLRAMAASLQQQGIHRIGLGVTKDNPALRLYQRLGFVHIQDVDAYAWWRQWP